MKHVEIDTSEARRFFDAVEAAAKGGLRKEMELWLEALGVEFLRIVQDEIIRRKVMDTRLLLASFHKGNDNSVWELSDGGLTLEVGSTLNYASYVNDGHWTNPKGVERRFVPGYWEGDRFIYDPSAEGGMVLKQKWVDGKPYFESALRILEKMMPGFLDAKMQEWIDNYFQ
ncbi:MAG: HK97 gp10 family phage protein [Clostridia bacterium]|nr:HK97 gp10 family phage protein [Clostridia bacterium]